MNEKEKIDLARLTTEWNDQYRKPLVPQVPLNDGSYISGEDMGPETSQIDTGHDANNRD